MSYFHLGAEGFPHCPPQAVNEHLRRFVQSLWTPDGRTEFVSDSEDMMQDQDRIEAYKQLKARASELGYASVNHALDALEEYREEPQA